MIEGVNNMSELYGEIKGWTFMDPRGSKDGVYGGVSAFTWQMDFLYSGNARDAAFSAWIDLMPEHEGRIEHHNKIYNALFRKTAQTEIKPEDDDKFTKLSTIEASLRHKFPSTFEKLARRKSFAHLIQILERNGEFDGNHEDIANILFDPYVVIDGGAQMNFAFKRKDLEDMHLDEDDLDDNANYAIIRALKEGKNVQIQYIVDGMIKTKDAFRKISREISKRNPGASMWTGFQHPSDGDTEGMEVVIVSGDMDVRSSRKTVGRWVYEDVDKDGNKIWTPLRYDKKQSLKVVSAYKRGNFMDIDNQGFIKESVERWIKEGPSSVLKSIPGGLEELVTAEFQPFNIGKFEYDEVVKPFWEKYGPKGENLTPELFAAKWEEVRLETTYTFEEKFWDLAWGDIFEPFRPSTAPVRYGARPDIKAEGGRFRRKAERDIEREFLLENSPSRGEGILENTIIERAWDSL